LFDGEYVLVAEDGSVVDPNEKPVTQYVWGKFWVNNHAHILKGKAGISNEQILLSLQSTNIRPYITGAVQLKINQANLKRIPFLKAAQGLNEAFSSKVSGLYKSFRLNEERAQTLANLRDLLLPKLISGEISLPEAERSNTGLQ